MSEIIETPNGYWLYEGIEFVHRQDAEMCREEDAKSALEAASGITRIAPVTLVYGDREIKTMLVTHGEKSRNEEESTDV